MADARRAAERPGAAATRTPFSHNVHVLRGSDPLSGTLPAGSPGAELVGASYGAYQIRVEGLEPDTATAFQRTVGTVGGNALTEERGGLVDLSLFVSLPQVEALRSQLLAAPAVLSHLVEEVATTLRSYHRGEFVLDCAGVKLCCGSKPLLMGVLNCTPDSFYPGSRAMADQAVRRGISMIEEGADLIDVGGESTRPGSDPVRVEEEIRRIEPVVRDLRRLTEVPISIDTTRAMVARAALSAGASMVNDVSGLLYDPELGTAVAEAGVPIVLMHMRGEPNRMYELANYRNVVAEVIAELREATTRATDAKIPQESVVIDPGIGFAKRAEHSLIVLRNLAAFRSLGRPMLVGLSRKSFIGSVLQLPEEERLEGTAAAVAAAVLAGAHIVRVHDVGPMRRVAHMTAAIRSEGVGWIT